jgi:hypothetical protein
MTGQPLMWNVSLKPPQPYANQPPIRLTAIEAMRPEAGRKFALADEYVVRGQVNRAYFSAVQNIKVGGHSIVWRCDNPTHPWYEELCGLRKAAYFTIKEVGLVGRWEMYIKPARDRQHVFGYLRQPLEIREVLVSHVFTLLKRRVLPLVLDLDDTLVRIISDEKGIDAVPTQIAEQYPERIRALKDGSRVMIAEGAEEFLDWAKQKFELQVCSVGHEEYVNAVTQVLNDNKERFFGQPYSARAEHNFLTARQQAQPNHEGKKPPPPKDLESVFAYCRFPFTTVAKQFIGQAYQMPLIVDDQTHSWPESQHDNIIVVADHHTSEVWGVCYQEVMRTLDYVHQEVFRRLEKQQREECSGNADLYDEWLRQYVEEKGGANVVGVYKEYLRGLLTRRIRYSVVQPTVETQ